MAIRVLMMSGVFEVLNMHHHLTAVLLSRLLSLRRFDQVMEVALIRLFHGCLFDAVIFVEMV